MASPRDVANLLYEYCPKAYLSELDHKAAFKLVPVQESPGFLFPWQILRGIAAGIWKQVFPSNLRSSS